MSSSDAKFPAAFDTVFASEGVAIVRTPYCAPNANAYAERWVRSAREECLDPLLIAGEAHRRRVLAEYSTYYNEGRPRQGLEQQCPMAHSPPVRDGPVRRRDRLGGLLHDYLPGGCLSRSARDGCTFRILREAVLEGEAGGGGAVLHPDLAVDVRHM